MDKETLGFLTNNLYGFISGTVWGSLTGYLNNHYGDKSKIVDASRTQKLGISTACIFASNVLHLPLVYSGMINLNMKDIMQGDPGAIAGFYLGINIGKVIDNGLARFYSKKPKKEKIIYILNRKGKKERLVSIEDLIK